ncbi:MAG: hypothetical protein WC343_04880 [Bacilli bacterium]|jgi:hypothetical protein
MKRLLSFARLFSVLFVFSCPFVLQTRALEYNTYKTTTNRNIIYVVENNGSFAYSWQFNKEQYKDDIPFSLSMLDTSSNITSINQYLDDKTTYQYLFFEHHGTLPTTALMKVKVSDEFNDGDGLYLYYYNDKTSKLEYIDHNLVVKNGYVSFEIEHCSDYILTGSIVKSALDNPQSMGVVIISLIVIGVILVAVTLFVNNKN